MFSKLSISLLAFVFGCCFQSNVLAKTQLVESAESQSRSTSTGESTASAYSRFLQNPPLEASPQEIQRFGATPKIVKQYENCYRVEALSGKLKINVPLGWKSFDDGRKLRMSNRSGVAVTVGFYDFKGRDDSTFQTFKEKTIKLNKEHFELEKLETSQVRFTTFDLARDGFGYQWEHRLVGGGDDLASASAVPAREVSFKTVFIPSNTASGTALRMQLQAPPESFGAFQSLIDLLVQDSEF